LTGGVVWGLIGCLLIAMGVKQSPGAFLGLDQGGLSRLIGYLIDCQAYMLENMLLKGNIFQ
jgi:hypothetical protein